MLDGDCPRQPSVPSLSSAYISQEMAATFTWQERLQPKSLQMVVEPTGFVSFTDFKVAFFFTQEVTMPWFGGGQILDFTVYILEPLNRLW